MPEFHYAIFRVHLHATEDREKVLKALRSAAGDEELVPEETRLEGHHGNPITLFEHTLKNKRRIDAFFEHLAQAPGVIETLHRQRDERLDDDGAFYLRLDKQAAYAENLRLGYDENTIRVRAKVRAYPKRRETALEQLTEYLEGLLAKMASGPGAAGDGESAAIDEP